MGAGRRHWRSAPAKEADLDTIGPWELLIVVLAIGLLVGANGLPQMARSLGEGIRELRSALHESSQPDNPEARHRQPA